MKIIALFLFCFLPICADAQNKTPTLEEAKSFLASISSPITFVIPDSDKDYVNYIDKEIGEIVIEGSHIYKIVEFKEAMSANYEFILLNSANLSPNEINTLRETIISKFKFGIPFSQLSEQYSINKSSPIIMEVGTNDFGRQFQAIADNHYAGDIFTLDPPILQNFAVVLKNSLAALRKFVIVQHAVYE